MPKIVKFAITGARCTGKEQYGCRFADFFLGSTNTERHPQAAKNVVKEIVNLWPPGFK